MSDSSVTHHTKVLGRSAQSYAVPTLRGPLVTVDLQRDNAVANGALMELPLTDARAILLLLEYAVRDAEALIA